MLGVTIIDLASVIWRYFVYEDALANLSDIDMGSIELSDSINLVISLANMTINVLVIVFFIMWFRRAYFNLHMLPWNNARYTEGWAAGGWFVPFINFFYPYHIMMDIWKGTQNALRARLGEPLSASIVGWWWGLFLLMKIINNIVSRIIWQANDLEDYVLAVKFEFVADILTIPTILIAVKMIQKTSYFEKELMLHSQTPSDSIFSDNYSPPVQNA